MQYRESNGGYTIQKAVYDIEHEYERKRAEIAESIPHDVLKYEGEISDWKDVIAVYAVKLNLSTDDPQEVATFDEKKAEQLKIIFFDITEMINAGNIKTGGALSANTVNSIITIIQKSLKTAYPTETIDCVSRKTCC